MNSETQRQAQTLGQAEIQHQTQVAHNKAEGLQTAELDTIRSAFPALHQVVNDERLIYFDNAATTHKPQTVIDRLVKFYQQDNANIHRGVHTLAQRATDQYERARQTVANFIGSQSASEISFTSGTTASLNHLARGLVEPQLKAGDQIMVTVLEHHSNLVPWQEVAKRTGAELIYAPLDPLTGKVDLARLANETDTRRLKVIAIQHVSNVLGLEQPIKAITDWAHQQAQASQIQAQPEIGTEASINTSTKNSTNNSTNHPQARDIQPNPHDILVIVDGAQAVAHLPVNVQALGVDAYCFSGHKLYAPTGIGVCYLQAKHHDRTQPTQFGGEMIHLVGDYQSNYKQAPWKFEAGTPPIAQAIALAEAIEFLTQFDWQTLQVHEKNLTHQLVQGLQSISGITLLHPPQQADYHGIVSYNIEGVHPHDAATGYDQEGIAIRAGHHCAQPLMRYLNVTATLRASLSLYNTQAEVEQFLQSTQAIKEFFAHGTQQPK
ncbi:aminotransferase class V-fold PLP-dependent enzyme [Fundicoccus ignavus]|uniref:aminotransferase class V-fold PLP-dependent enzyme n=1 Tax=Fundicoccus ignavus TaxID=2664442 RepID=UPI00129C4CFB|nr:aminotransferase class V-fold PLP-dependent enzyme [Fundicoccus ignavus]